MFEQGKHKVWRGRWDQRFNAALQQIRGFPASKIPDTIDLTSALMQGIIEAIAGKEVTRGRYIQDRRQTGTQEAEARSP